MSLIKIILNESIDNKYQNNFLGYHSSRKNIPNGLSKGEPLSEIYEELIRTFFIEYIDDNQEYNIDEMIEVFNENGFGFTFVSKYPIESSVRQNTKYKYGNNLYKVYGNGREYLLDDINEIDATLVVSKNPLYFERVGENESN
jgi:hypothetical protein